MMTLAAMSMVSVLLAVVHMDGAEQHARDVSWPVIIYISDVPYFFFV